MMKNILVIGGGSWGTCLSKLLVENGHPIAQSNLADLFFTQGNKEKAIFGAKKAYRNGAKLPDELKILININ